MLCDVIPKICMFHSGEGVLWMVSPISKGRRSVDDFVVVLRVTKNTTDCAKIVLTQNSLSCRNYRKRHRKSPSTCATM